MVKYHTFYEYEDNIELTLSFDNYYRSSISRASVKHCYEFTILNEMASYGFEIGFSCVYNARTFVAAYEEKILRKINNNDKNYKCDDFKYKQGDTIEVCYDSVKQNFTIINNKYFCTAIVEFTSPVTWFAYLDHQSGGTDSVSLNLGKKTFSNPLLQGYEPWFSIENIEIYSNNQYQSFHSKVFVSLFLFSSI